MRLSELIAEFGCSPQSCARTHVHTHTRIYCVLSFVYTHSYVSAVRTKSGKEKKGTRKEKPNKNDEEEAEVERNTDMYFAYTEIKPLLV